MNVDDGLLVRSRNLIPEEMRDQFTEVPEELSQAAELETLMQL